MTSHACRGKCTGLLWGFFLMAILTYLLLYIKLTNRNTPKHHMTAYWLQWIAFMDSKKINSAFDSSNNESSKFNDSINCISQNLTTEILDLCQKSERGATDNGFIPFNKFEYPLEIDMNDLVSNLKTAKNVSIKPIFSYPYTFVKSPTWMCEYRDVRLLILVKSGVSHFKRREMIRYTWGNYTESGVVTLFLLGSTPHVMFQRRILQEHHHYGDILQMSFFDAYYNNTLKTVGGIKWARNHCNQSKFVLFTDDDFYIATELLLKYIENMQRFERTSVYRGAMWKRGRPIRNELNKWYISRQDYPFDHYPDFVAAGFMLMSIDFVIDLDLAIPYTKKFIFDDVFISIVAYKLHVQPSHMNSVHINKFPYNREGFRQIIASHGYDRTSTLQQAWWIHQNRHLHKSGRKSIRAYSVRAT
ncbi:beta-1,3-galactosyltransferase brn-like [Mizuhopecten yessoensis]|uniref:Hexosyltransferase n=1 Tax=Mizuhopecten yessoensis TaxID=6573 RepID=A0A210QA32_MIZYE|nr:beta-1,3-galactosyltransferase brn-like [Mizuhopecten yessoensis]XP_021363488.1 beta-1,3-galactosyltransferase brn-like [Mizuhopecten yessoensis]XP_021363489.1 beta-1,3-galactosyltransferase brn-like [Mizuhopecten yessoensis]OWF45594.1 Beta-1,3-galactosyltransferase brn [Mizuhopecten yessoensis]